MDLGASASVGVSGAPRGAADTDLLEAFAESHARTDVVDRKGNPLLVYRGLPAGADPARPASPTGLTWFTTDRDDAVDYSPAVIVEAYLTAENLANLDTRKVKAILRKAGLDPDNLFDLSEEGATTRQALMAAGYGGAYVARPDIGKGVGHYAVFDPSQIQVAGGFKVPQVETRQFKSWFGKSQVVGEQGGPLVVYRGGQGEIPAFDGTGTVHFSASTRIADLYARGYYKTAQEACITPVYLRIENPIDLRNPEVIGQVLHEADVFLGEELIHNPVELKEAAKKLMDAGFDGIIVEHEISLGAKDGTLEYIIFEPTQAKSAIGNCGDFDRGNPDLRA
jgi:hypothetical protein